MFRYLGFAAGFFFAVFYLGKRYVRKYARLLESATDRKEDSE